MPTAGQRHGCGHPTCCNLVSDMWRTPSSAKQTTRDGHLVWGAGGSNGRGPWGWRAGHLTTHTRQVLLQLPAAANGHCGREGHTHLMSRNSRRSLLGLPSPPACGSRRQGMHQRPCINAHALPMQRSCHVAACRASSHALQTGCTHAACRIAVDVLTSMKGGLDLMPNRKCCSETSQKSCLADTPGGTSTYMLTSCSV